MSTQPPDHPSSSASFNEIEQVEQDTNDPTQINNNNNNNREIDNPKEKRRKNSEKPKSIDTATNMEPRSNDGDNNKSNREAKAKAEAEAEAEAEALHKLIRADLSSIKNASERINKYEEPIKQVSDRFEKFEQKRGTADEYRELKKVVKKLKQQISSKHKDDDSDAARKLWSIDSTNITGANGRGEGVVEDLSVEGEIEGGGGVSSTKTFVSASMSEERSGGGRVVVVGEVDVGLP